MKPLKIKSAFLHASITSPGLSGVVTLTPEKTPHCQMTWESDLLFIETDKETVIVPAANVKCMVLQEPYSLEVIKSANKKAI